MGSYAPYCCKVAIHVDSRDLMEEVYSGYEAAALVG
jgi:hypothetical protein